MVYALSNFSTYGIDYRFFPLVDRLTKRRSSMSSQSSDGADGLPSVILAIVAMGTGDIAQSSPMLQAAYPEQTLSNDTLSVFLNIEVILF
jgi:hypothetical protein